MVFQIYSNASISFPYRSGMGLELICQDVHGPKLAEAVLAVGPDVFFFFFQVRSVEFNWRPVPRSVCERRPLLKS